MLSALRRLFTGQGDDPLVSLARVNDAPHPALEMAWHEGPSWPIPDWKATAAHHPSMRDDATAHAAWTQAARQWLDRMAQQWEHGYAVRESPEFLLLSALSARDTAAFLRFCESARERILLFLDGLARAPSRGKHVVVVMDDQDDYYDYISHYYPDGGEYSLSSGVFLHAGYGHFVLWAGELDAMEPVVAHELTHNLVSHLRLPLWLDEGIAVNTEHRIFPHLASPRAQLYFPHEMVAKHKAFWNEQTIQEFWSGDAFARPDDGSMLAYDLATKMTALAARDFDTFRRFALAANRVDAGVGAEEMLGYPVHHLVEAVLGEGTWQPVARAVEDQRSP